MNPYAVRQLLRASEFRPSKKLGQNFLTDQNVARKLVRLLAPARNEVFLEIGAGTGALTLPLAEHGVIVFAVEVDKRLVRILKAALKGFPNAEILQRDILRVDIARLLERADATARSVRVTQDRRPSQGGADASGGFPVLGGLRADKVQVLGNLPYSITTQVLLYLIQNRLRVGRALLTVQKEYAERLMAKPGTRQYGSISVFVRFYAEIEHLMNISARCFFPRPDVSSSVLRIEFRERPAVRVKDQALFDSVVRAAFSHRRKMVLNSIAERFELDKDSLLPLFGSAGVDGTKRAEQLELEELARIADVFYEERLALPSPGGPEKRQGSA
jgi:16S rRNA (adenine1518-N6/adenine1519-N6)-dimethyltransferase